MIIVWPQNINLIKNRYFYSYEKLIERALARKVDNNKYYENHHIIPRSMGGDNKHANLVKLTAKEHYLAHRFLTRFVTNQYLYKMLYALDALGMQSKNTINRYRMPARIYEYNKNLISQIGHSEETKKKIGIANKGRSPINKGVPRSEETRRKISVGHIGIKGTPASDKTKESASKYHGNSIWIHLGDKNKRIQIDQKDQYSKLGWIPGRGKVTQPTHRNFTVTDEHKAYMKNIMSQMMWLNHPLLQKRLRIHINNLESYLSQGWKLGRKFT